MRLTGLQRLIHLTGEVLNDDLEHMCNLSGFSLCCVRGEYEACHQAEIEEELEEQVRYFKGEDKLLEAQRIAERTNFDIEMLRETGFCSGIENYSRHLTGHESRGSRLIH